MDHGGLAMPGMPGMVTDLPPFTLGRGLAFGGDPFFLVLCVLLLALYGWGVVRLGRRGDGWPVGRTVAFAVGVLTVGVTLEEIRLAGNLGAGVHLAILAVCGFFLATSASASVNAFLKPSRG